VRTLLKSLREQEVEQESRHGHDDERDVEWQG
jgi:hypothetical protein